jgi:hypothetical protein
MPICLGMYALLLILSLFIGEAQGAPILISQDTSFLNTVNGRSLNVRANRQYRMEVVSVSGDTVSVRLRDNQGALLAGNFTAQRRDLAWLPAGALPPAPEGAGTTLDPDILRSAPSGPATPNTPCCDVVEPRPPPTPRPAPTVPTQPIPGVTPGRATPVPPLPPTRTSLIRPNTPPAAPRIPAPEVSTRREAPVGRSPANSLCRAFNEFRRQGVPEAPLRQALFFLSREPNHSQRDRQIRSRRYVSIADYSQNSRRERFYVLDLEQLTVKKDKVSHGTGSVRRPGDRNHDGMLDSCGTTNSLTRAGFFRADELYFSQNGRLRRWTMVAPGKNGLRLQGLSPGANWNSRDQGVVMHEARYNRSGNAVMGRSWGCPAFVPGRGAPIMRQISNGTLFYSYAPQCRPQMEPVLRQVAGWENFCR